MPSHGFPPRLAEDLALGPAFSFGPAFHLLKQVRVHPSTAAVHHVATLGTRQSFTRTPQKVYIFRICYRVIQLRAAEDGDR